MDPYLAAYIARVPLKSLIAAGISLTFYPVLLADNSNTKRHLSGSVKTIEKGLMIMDHCSA